MASRLGQLAYSVVSRLNATSMLMMALLFMLLLYNTPIPLVSSAFFAILLLIRLGCNYLYNTTSSLRSHVTFLCFTLFCTFLPIFAGERLIDLNRVLHAKTAPCQPMPDIFFMGIFSNIYSSVMVLLIGLSIPLLALLPNYIHIHKSKSNAQNILSKLKDQNIQLPSKGLSLYRTHSGSYIYMIAPAACLIPIIFAMIAAGGGFVEHLAALCYAITILSYLGWRMFYLSTSSEEQLWKTCSTDFCTLRHVLRYQFKSNKGNPLLVHGRLAKAWNDELVEYLALRNLTHVNLKGYFKLPCIKSKNFDKTSSVLSITLLNMEEQLADDFIFGLKRIAECRLTQIMPYLANSTISECSAIYRERLLRDIQALASQYGYADYEDLPYFLVRVLDVENNISLQKLKNLPRKKQSLSSLAKYFGLEASAWTPVIYEDSIVPVGFDKDIDIPQIACYSKPISMKADAVDHAEK